MAGKVHSLDMVEGRILPQLIRFSLPLMMTSLLQLLYNAADVAVAHSFPLITADADATLSLSFFFSLAVATVQVASANIP